MSEFFKLMKMELGIFRRPLVQLFLLYVLVSIAILCSRNYHASLAPWLIGIIFFAIFVLPNGIIMGIPNQEAKYFLTNPFRMILPAKPGKICLVMLVCGGVVLLLLYVLAAAIMLFLGQFAYNPAVFPFVLFTYMQTFFTLLTFNQDVSRARLVGESFFWTFPAFCFPIGMLMLATDCWSWLAILTGGVLTAVNCYLSWKYIVTRRGIPWKIRLFQVAVLVIAFGIVAGLNWQGDIMKTLEHSYNKLYKTEVKNVR